MGLQIQGCVMQRIQYMHFFLSHIQKDRLDFVSAAERPCLTDTDLRDGAAVLYQQQSDEHDGLGQFLPAPFTLGNNNHLYCTASVSLPPCMFATSPGNSEEMDWSFYPECLPQQRFSTGQQVSANLSYRSDSLNL